MYNSINRLSASQAQEELSALVDSSQAVSLPKIYALLYRLNHLKEPIRNKQALLMLVLHEAEHTLFLPNQILGLKIMLQIIQKYQLQTEEAHRSALFAMRMAGVANVTAHRYAMRIIASIVPVLSNFDTVASVCANVMKQTIIAYFASNFETDNDEEGEIAQGRDPRYHVIKNAAHSLALCAHSQPAVSCNVAVVALLQYIHADVFTLDFIQRIMSSGKDVAGKSAALRHISKMVVRLQGRCVSTQFATHLTTFIQNECILWIDTLDAVLSSVSLEDVNTVSVLWRCIALILQREGTELLRPHYARLAARVIAAGLVCLEDVALAAQLVTASVLASVQSGVDKFSWIAKAHYAVLRAIKPFPDTHQLPPSLKALGLVVRSVGVNKENNSCEAEQTLHSALSESAIRYSILALALYVEDTAYHSFLSTVDVPKLVCVSGAVVAEVHKIGVLDEWLQLVAAAAKHAHYRAVMKSTGFISYAVEWMQMKECDLVCAVLGLLLLFRYDHSVWKLIAQTDVLKVCQQVWVGYLRGERTGNTIPYTIEIVINCLIYEFSLSAMYLDLELVLKMRVYYNNQFDKILALLLDCIKIKDKFVHPEALFHLLQRIFELEASVERKLFALKKFLEILFPYLKGLSSYKPLLFVLEMNLCFKEQDINLILDLVSKNELSKIQKLVLTLIMYQINPIVSIASKKSDKSVCREPQLWDETQYFNYLKYGFLDSHLIQPTLILDLINNQELIYTEQQIVEIYLIADYYMLHKIQIKVLEFINRTDLGLSNLNLFAKALQRLPQNNMNQTLRQLIYKQSSFRLLYLKEYSFLHEYLNTLIKPYVID